MDRKSKARTTSVKSYPIGEISLDPSNVRTHGDKNLDAIKASLKRFGQQKPIVVDRDLIVRAGNGTLEAASALGWETINAVVSELSDSELTAYAIADNRTAELAEWDMDDLQKQLASLDEELRAIAYDDFEMPEEPPEPGENDDKVPEVDQNPYGVKRGDVWLLGDHRLMCGDSTDEADVALLMDGEKADMVFTDPPYNIAGNILIGNAFGKNKSKGSEMLQSSEWDKGFVIADVLTNIEKNIKEPFGIIIFTSQYLAGEIWDWMKPFCHWFGFAFYERTNPTPMSAITNGKMLISTDLACYGYSKGHKIKHPDGKYLSNVWRSAKVHKKDFVGHPTQKPVDMISSILESIDFDICLDLFLGSGSTLIACEKTKRKCYGMELDENYCSVIIKRWEEYAGGTAHKI